MDTITIGMFIAYENQIFIVSRIWMDFVDLIAPDGRRQSVSISELQYCPGSNEARNNFFKRDAGDLLCLQYLLQVGFLEPTATLVESQQYFESLGNNGCSACQFCDICPVCIINE